MATGDGNERIGAGGALAAGVLSLGILLYIGHAIVETSRWARDHFLRFIEIVGLTELAATTFSVGDIILGGILALMTWALWHLNRHHLIEGMRPTALAVLQVVRRNRRMSAVIATWLLMVTTPLGIGLLLYNSARSTDEMIRQRQHSESVVSKGDLLTPPMPFDARWVEVGRSFYIRPSDFLEIKVAAAPLAREQVAENPCAINEEFTSEELAACVDDLKKHPPRTGWGGPRRWFIHKLNGRLVFDPVVGPPPLPKTRPQLPLNLSPSSE